MSAVLTIAKREFRSYFDSPLAYVVICLSFFALGLMYFMLNGGFWQADRSSIERLFEYAPMGLSFLVVPVVTMRLIAEERRSGTLEMLITLPVKDSDVVLGKYLGALGPGDGAGRRVRAGVRRRVRAGVRRRVRAGVRRRASVPGFVVPAAGVRPRAGRRVGLGAGTDAGRRHGIGRGAGGRVGGRRGPWSARCRSTASVDEPIGPAAPDSLSESVDAVAESSVVARTRQREQIHAQPGRGGWTDGVF